MAKVRIALVGEDPADTHSLRNLISPEFKNAQFVDMLRNFTGNMLESRSAMRFLRNEFEDKKPKAVVFIRDLDGFQSQEDKMRGRETYFKECHDAISGKSIPLLNIYSIEALIYADIATFNKEYSTKIKFQGDPAMVLKPKEKLKSLTYRKSKRYHENQNPELFSKLNLSTVRANCAYFHEFLETLSQVAK
jgi:hypothetical protein